MSRPVSRRTLALTGAGVFLLALAARLLWPPGYITWDEPTWTYRSLRFARALQTSNLAGTYQSPHPGVVTMWAGAAAAFARDASVRFDDGRTDAAVSGRAEPGRGLAWIDALPPFDEGDTAILAILAPWLPAGRAAIALLTSALIAACFLLAARLVAPGPAAVAGALLALDPYLLAHSRVLHLDAVLALLLLVSVLALLAFASGRGGRPTLLVSGAAAGLAVAEKTPAAIILPFAVALIAAWTLQRTSGSSRSPAGGNAARAAARSGALALAWWSASAVLTYCAVWPAMWATPGATLAAMLAYARQSAGGAREAVFFAGRVHADPGTAFYPVALAFRISPLVVLGLACAAVGWRRMDAVARRAVVGLVAFAVTYIVFMALGDKKFERYVLPAMPPLDVVAGLGLALAAERLTRPLRRRRGLAAAAIGTLILVQTVHVATRRPYYLSYYSPLLGGGQVAARWLPVGWGEGMDLAARYLNSMPAADARTVATPSVALLAPLVTGRTLPARRWSEADSVVLYVDDVQIGQPAMVAEVRRSVPPDHVVRLFGIDYAWVYDRRDAP